MLVSNDSICNSAYAIIICYSPLLLLQNSTVSFMYQSNQEGNPFLTNIWHGMYLPVITPYAQNSVNTYLCHSNPSRSLLDYSMIASGDGITMWWCHHTRTVLTEKNPSAHNKVTKCHTMMVQDSFLGSLLVLPVEL